METLTGHFHTIWYALFCFCTPIIPSHSLAQSTEPNYFWFNCTARIVLKPLLCWTPWSCAKLGGKLFRHWKEFSLNSSFYSTSWALALLTDPILEMLVWQLHISLFGQFPSFLWERISRAASIFISFLFPLNEKGHCRTITTTWAHAVIFYSLFSLFLSWQQVIWL